MKKIDIIIVLLSLLTPAMTKAQYAINDTIRTERIVVRSSQFGISLQNNLDTYLSNYKYTGGGLHFSHESFRDAHTGSYHWKYQILFNSRIAYNLQKGNIQISGIAGCSWSGYHPFNVGKRLKLLAGAQIQLEGGALYNLSNSNNPVSAKLRTALAASGMAIYHFPVLGNDWVARYQLDIPLIGAMFTPEFGQSYYEMSIGHLGRIVSFTYPLNNPSWRHMLSLDIPLQVKRHSTTLRLSYVADLYQSDINHIRCHMYHHAITFGFVRTFFKVKKENSIKAYSPYQYMMFKKLSIAIIVTITTLTGCISEENFENSNIGNFEALWKVVDEHYCFFDLAEKEYGLNWDEVYDKYKPIADTCKNESELFNILGEMLGELHDGHVNLVSMYGTSYFWDWKLDYPINFSDSIQRNYLGNDFKLTNGIKYTTLSDSIGYAYYGSFSSGLNINNLSLMLLELKNTKGLILDIRNNGGGLITTAETLASAFTDEKIHCGYMQHKTGPGHNDFSDPEKIYLEPSEGVIWLLPVIVLTNRGVYSAANHFVMLMNELPNVLILGDRTGGGSGLPMSYTIPNGWSIRMSACPTLDREGNSTEFGIEPDLRVNISSRDWDNGRDTMIEAAKTIILEYYEKK